jgi:hypothetical protein
MVSLVAYEVWERKADRTAARGNKRLESMTDVRTRKIKMREVVALKEVERIGRV